MHTRPVYTGAVLAYLKFTVYRCLRWLLRKLLKPSLPDMPSLPDGAVYVMEKRSLSDLLVLDIMCEAEGLPAPLAYLAPDELDDQRRVTALTRNSGWIVQRHTMKHMSPGLTRLHAFHNDQRQRAEADAAASLASGLEISLHPVSIFWGRAPRREHSIWQSLVSEQWTVTSRFRRLLGLFFNRADILVDFGQPITLAEDKAELDPERALRRTARLLRVRFRNQRVAVLGPDVSHRRVLLDRILLSSAVRREIAKESSPKERRKLQRRARRYARRIASHMSYPTIRVLERLLTFFWNRVYSGIEVSGLHQVKAVAQTHTIIYAPSHRSHFDYLLLSYLLFHEGLMIPHIAAGDNLNMPVVGPLLRRGGAFFMRRRFKGDALYSAVFSEYLYQVYQAGHSVEFFIEGGRTRTGRLLAAKTGLLSMTLDHYERGLSRPVAIVPVYFGYERLLEARSYLDELRGAAKTRESLSDVFSSLKLLREDFGRVQVNFAEPIELSDAVAEARSRAGDNGSDAKALGNLILSRINDAASVNPINLVALTTLATPRVAIERDRLERQIDTCLSLLAWHEEHWAVRPSAAATTGAEVVDYAIELGMLDQESHSFGEVCTHDAIDAVLMTWFRNNVQHVFCLPSLIACLFINRRRGLSTEDLTGMVRTTYPYVAEELQASLDLDQELPVWLDSLVNAGLIRRSAAGRLSVPAPDDPGFDSLTLLASIVMPILERQYILIAILDRRAPGSEAELIEACQGAAKRISRLYGINAPEFFDPRLFREFAGALKRRGQLLEDPDGQLTSGPLVAQTLRAAQYVLHPGIRQSVLSLAADPALHGESDEEDKPALMDTRRTARNGEAVDQAKPDRANS